MDPLCIGPRPWAVMKETPDIIGDLRQCMGPRSVRPPPWAVVKETPDVIGGLVHGSSKRQTPGQL